MDLRKCVVAAYDQGQSKSEVARRFGVSRWTVARYVSRVENGKLAATPHPGPKPWLDEAQCKILKEQVEDHSDWTLEQHAQALAELTKVVLKKSAVDKYFRKLGITHKKRAFTQQSETSKPEQTGSQRLPS